MDTELGDHRSNDPPAQLVEAVTDRQVDRCLDATSMRSWEPQDSPVSPTPPDGAIPKESPSTFSALAAVKALRAAVELFAPADGKQSEGLFELWRFGSDAPW